MTDPSDIRADIEKTRNELGQDVDALADKVTPSKIAHRQTEKVKDAIFGVKDKVMGAASDVEDHAHSAMSNMGDTMSDVGDSLSNAPKKAVSTAKGNPLAVGLIALGVGWLVSSLMPASQPEKRAAGKLKDAAAPVAAELKDVAKEAADDLRQPAKDAANAVKDTATDAANTVKDEGTSAASSLKDDAKDAKQNLQGS